MKNTVALFFLYFAIFLCVAEIKSMDHNNSDRGYHSLAKSFNHAIVILKKQQNPQLDAAIQFLKETAQHYTAMAQQQQILHFSRNIRNSVRVGNGNNGNMRSKF